MSWQAAVGSWQECLRLLNFQRFGKRIGVIIYHMNT